jgi:hypothetical protein
MPEDGDRPLVFWLFARGLQRFPVLIRLSLPGLTWLDPAIHPFRKKMDARVKPAHDDANPRPCSLLVGVGGDGLEPPTSCV